MPGRAGGPLRSSAPASTPRVPASPRDSASSGVMLATSTPNQPRVTDPVSMISSMTLLRPMMP